MRAYRTNILICFFPYLTSVMCSILTRPSSNSDPKLYMIDNGEVLIGRFESLQNASAMLPISAPFRFRDQDCNRDRDCSDPEEVCVLHSCVCKKFFHYERNERCVPCPGQGERCDTCCSDALFCCLGACKWIDEPCQEPKGVFVTASQVALSAALIMGFAALAMVVYRLCTRPTFLTARQRTPQRSAETVAWGQTSFLHASLTSMQIRVLNRMRDRPPAYEHQTRSRREVSSPEVIPVSEAPPPYVECRISSIHQPPQYSEVILDPREFVNNAYEDTENVVATNERTSNAPAKMMVVPSTTK